MEAGATGAFWAGRDAVGPGQEILFDLAADELCLRVEITVPVRDSKIASASTEATPSEPDGSKGSLLLYKFVEKIDR